MDTTQPVQPPNYIWPTAILAAYDLKPPEIGMVAWMPYSHAGAIGNLYVPITVGKMPSRAARAGYRAILLAPFDLTEVYVTFARVASDNHLEKAVRDSAPLRYGYYPANSPITVELPGITKRGVYFAEFTADIAGGGGKTALNFWVYIP